MLPLTNIGVGNADRARLSFHARLAHSQRLPTCGAGTYSKLGGALLALFRSVVVMIAVFGLAGCELRYEEETALFERAEVRYAHGDYDTARELYEAFLSLHPLSPLVGVAEQRLLMIDREIDAVMGRRGAPAPIRVNSYGGVTTPEPEDLPVRVEAPSLRVLTP